MRILVLADIHSNWEALAAIDESFDACLVIGDIVDYGPNPAPCIDWVRRNADTSVRGNHDHAIAQRVIGRGSSGYRRLAAAVRPYHWEVLDPFDLKYLGRLPVMQHIRLGDLRLLLVHATPRDPLDEYLTDDAEQWRQRLEGIEADIVCVGHTHVPFCLSLGDTRVLNPGSVGQPRDGNPHASYAIVEDGTVSLHRVEYDIEASVRQMQSTGLAEWTARLYGELLRRGGQLTREEMDAIV